MKNGHIQFDLSFGRHRQTTSPRQSDEPFRILVLGNLSGRSTAQSKVALAERKPIYVDIDNLDRIFARLAPYLECSLDAAPLTIEFSALDDFHPESLYQRLAPFVALRKLREELNDPATYRRAALALGAPPADTGRSAVDVEEDAATIERLLGQRPMTAPDTPARPGFDMDLWLKGIIAPYVMPDIAHEQRHLLAAVDAAIAEQMRRVLHHPGFQSLEATWRGIEGLVRNLETGETLQLFLLDMSREELVRDLEGNAADLSQSALYRHLCGPDTEPPDGQGWSLLVGDYAFGSSTEDMALLTALGAMAARAEAPLIAAARPEILGCADIKQLAEPKSWPPATAEAQKSWNSLRQSAVAPWIGLALPRVLARLPYGASTDPIAAFAFEELPASRDHEAYLWGNPALAMARLAAQAFLNEGWAMNLDGQLDVTDLPSHTWRENGETSQQPCAELLLSESAGTALLLRGIMPLLSYRNRNAARLLRWQSIADPAQPLQGAWVMAGRG